MNDSLLGQISALRSRLGRRGMVIISIVLVSILIAFTSIRLLANAPFEPVLCLTAISGSDGEPHVVYQKAGTTREEVMQSDGLGNLIEEGYEVLEETCFETWQDAADYFTNGEVMLPEYATEEDFMLALQKWSSMKLK
jgi:hypothetical protein